MLTILEFQRHFFVFLCYSGNKYATSFFVIIGIIKDTCCIMVRVGPYGQWGMLIHMISLSGV